MEEEKESGRPRRRWFSDEVKRDAVETVRTSGKPVAQVARELGIDDSTLRNWVKQDRIDRGEAERLSPEERARLRELERDKDHSLRPIDSTGPELNPVSVFRRHWPLVLAFIVAFAILGAAFASTRSKTFVATAGLVVEDARSSTLLGGRSTDVERYVADQVAILESRAVAERASELAPTLDPPRNIETTDFLANTSIAFSADTDFITISFSAGDRFTAQVGANAVGVAYQEVTESALAQDANTAIELLDEAIDSAIADLVTLQAEIESLRSDSDERAELNDQLADIVSELAELRRAGGQIDAADLASIENATARAEQLSAELRARLLVSDVEARMPATALLLRRQEDALTLLSELTRRRSQIEVDARLAGNGVVFFAPAGVGTSRGVSTASAVLLSTVLGALLGAGVAYWLNQTRRRFEGRLEPQSVLGAPLLVEISGIPLPRRVAERVASLAETLGIRLPGRVAERASLGRTKPVDALEALIPVARDETSPTAEGFRVLVGALQHRLSLLPDLGSSRKGSGPVIAAVSAAIDEGKTVVAVNTALAAARAGLHVLLVDGDFGAQQASQLLTRLPTEAPRVGLAEVIREGAHIGDAISRIDIADGAQVDLLGRGEADVVAPDLFASWAMTSTLDELAYTYDLVLLDVPPLLEAAYAASAVQRADYALVVVRHHGRVADLEDVRYRLRLIGVPAVGYVYASGPVRRKFKTTGGIFDGVPETDEPLDVLIISQPVNGERSE